MKLPLPLTSAALAGKAALASLEAMATVSFVLTRFQLASTLLTVTLNPVPAVCAVGVPVLPMAVAGAAVSPGANNCNFTNAPGLTVMDGLVLEFLRPSVMSVAVSVALPPDLRVTLNVCVPADSAALPGKVALASLDVR